MTRLQGNVFLLRNRPAIIAICGRSVCADVEDVISLPNDWPLGEPDHFVI